MRNRLQFIFTFICLLVSFVWLKIPALEYYSTQFAGLLILVYLVIRFFTQKHLFPWTKQHQVKEFGLVTASLYLLIGASGNLQSMFFPFTYIHLFFLAMSLSMLESVALTVCIILFHLGLTNRLSTTELNQLISIPLLLLTFLYAKFLLDESSQKSQQISQQEETIGQEQTDLTLFVATFLKPKLENVLKLAEYPGPNKETIQRQIVLILEAIHEELSRLQRN